jgi:hypothetical protein
MRNCSGKLDIHPEPRLPVTTRINRVCTVFKTINGWHNKGAGNGCL